MSPRRRLSLRTSLVLSHLAVLILPVGAVVATGTLARELHRQARLDLVHQADLLVVMVEALESRGAPLEGPLRDAAKRTGVEVSQVDVADADRYSAAPKSEESETERMEREAIRFALAGKPDRTGLKTSPVGLWPARRPHVVALPLRDTGGKVEGALVVRQRRERFVGITYLGTQLAVGGALALTLTIALALFSAARLAAPLRSLARAAHNLGAGRFEPLILERQATVAETEELTSAFARMTAELSRRMGWIQEFAGHVSHEFRTPLSTLQGTVELLQDHPDMPEERRRRFLDNAARELERMGRLATGLISLARAEEPGEQGPVDLLALVEERIGDRPVQIQGDFGLTLGDETQLSSVVGNLLDNALQHGGSGVTVVVEGHQTDEQVFLRIIDDGPGISPANLPKVFDRFFTTRRDAGGTGLGLALARTLCRAHGGELEVESQPGRTLFTVRLPRAPGT